METKVCNYCNFEKPLNFFTKGKVRCKKCLALIKQLKYKKNPELFLKWRKENPEKAKESNRKWQKENPEKIKLKKKRYNEKNINKNREYCRLWRENNPNYKKKYYGNNREKLCEYERNRKDDVVVKLSSNIRCRVNNFLKLKNISKKNKTFDIVGCSPFSLKEYIEKKFTEGMSWEKMGQYIHIDHIIPLSSAKTEEEVYKLCHYTNLQPLWAKDNLRKHNKIV